jgi:hypothetical protein
MTDRGGPEGVEFDKTGKQLATWGKHGKGQGDSNGKFVAEWKQFGRPSDVLCRQWKAM